MDHEMIPSLGLVSLLRGTSCMSANRLTLSFVLIINSVDLYIVLLGHMYCDGNRVW